MARIPGVKLSAQEINAALSELNSSASVQWQIGSAGKLAKTFSFKDFKQAWAFMSQVALHAEQHDHHPEWFNVYNRVAVQLVTHDCDGISAKDFALARFMEGVSPGAAAKQGAAAK